MDYTITLTDEEVAVATFYHINVDMWIQQTVHGLVDHEMNATVLNKVKQLLQAGEPIPDSRSAILALIDLTPIPFPQPPPTF